METENHQGPTKPRASLGRKSLIAMGIFVCTLFPSLLWADQPQYHGPGGLGMGMFIGFGALLFWLPLLITSTVLSIKSIWKNDGRIQGSVTLMLVLAVIFWIFTSTS